MMWHTNYPPPPPPPQPTNIPTKYQLPITYDFCDIPQTTFQRSKSLQQGQTSNQGDTKHCTPIPPTNASTKYQHPTSYGIVWTKFQRSR